MKKCWVFSNGLFNKFMAKNNWNKNNIPQDCAFISICTPDWKDYDDPSIGSHWFEVDSNNVINLDFHDITNYTLPGRDDIYGMSDDQAKKLFEFIERNIGKDFYIHCSAGMSRSQGVARFIMNCYNEIYDEKTCQNPNNLCEFPNLHVVSLLTHLWYDKYMN